MGESYEDINKNLSKSQRELADWFLLTSILITLVFGVPFILWLTCCLQTRNMANWRTTLSVQYRGKLPSPDSRAST